MHIQNTICVDLHALIYTPIRNPPRYALVTGTHDANLWALIHLHDTFLFEAHALYCQSILNPDGVLTPMTTSTIEYDQKYTLASLRTILPPTPITGMKYARTRARTHEWCGWQSHNNHMWQGRMQNYRCTFMAGWYIFDRVIRTDYVNTPLHGADIYEYI